MKKKAKKIIEMWLTQHSRGGRMDTADVWYEDPRKTFGKRWNKKWKVYHVRVVEDKDDTKANQD